MSEVRSLGLDGSSGIIIISFYSFSTDWEVFIINMPRVFYVKIFIVIKGGGMGEISNFYHFSPRMLIFGTHMPPAVTMHAAKFH